MQTLNRFHRQLEALPQFVVLAAPPAPPETDLKVMVRDILEGAPDRIYRDGIESVDSAALDKNGDLVGEFSDRIGVRSIKKFSYKISDNGVEYSLLNSHEAAKFSAYQSDVLLMFAPMYGKGSRAKKKNCTKSVSCGNGCIASGKTCRKGGTDLSDGTKAKIKAAKAAAVGGGAIAVIPKKNGEKKANSTTFGVDAIDAKYASDNPSDADVEAWYKEKIAEKPSAAQAEQDIVNEIKPSIFGLDPKGKPFKDRVVDAESYAKAKYAVEQLEIKRRIEFGLRQNDDESLWFDSLTERFGETNAVLEKKIAKAKDEKTRIKLQKKLDDYKLADEAAVGKAKELAAKHKDINSQTKKQRIANLSAEFETLKAARLKTNEDLHERVIAGDRNAIKQKREQVFKRLPVEQRFEALQESDRPKIYGKEAVRKHLIAVSNNTLVPEFNLPAKFSQADVKKSYRSLAAKYHPDTGGSADKFNRLSAVYEDLLLKASK
jgi:hypothetical protein